MNMSDVQSASKRCLKCDTSVWDDAKFCSECGYSLVAAEPPRDTLTEVKEFALGTVTEIQKGSREALKSETGKKMAAGAATGAVLATAIPFVGWGTGAFLGAGFIAYKRLTS